MRGQVIYIYAYDVAYEIDLKSARELLKEPSDFLQPPLDKTLPRDFPFYKPLYFSKPAMTFHSSLGLHELRPEVKVFSFGALSISFCLEFEVSDIRQLLGFHSIKLEGGKTVDELANDLCEQVRSDLAPHLIKATSQIGNPEAYTIFCFKDGHSSPTVQEWLEVHRREIAGLLTEEANFEKLSESEVHETIRFNHSYTTQDLFVVDWNSALIVDPEDKPKDLLYILEVANLQLTELRHYDRFLEAFLDLAYDDIEAYSKKPPFLKGPGKMLRKLKQMRIDVTKISGEISNITKFFGDWHLARIYMSCRERFHLKEWEDSVEGMLRTLDNLYNLVVTDMNNRRLILLEVAIVVLFVVDLLFFIFKLK